MCCIKRAMPWAGILCHVVAEDKKLTTRRVVQQFSTEPSFVEQAVPPECSMRAEIRFCLISAAVTACPTCRAYGMSR